MKSKLYYWLECDGCGISSTEGGEHSAWSDEAYAVEDAECGDWIEYERDTEAGERNVHLCPKCAPRDGEGCLWEELP